MFGRTADYALRAVLLLAREKHAGRQSVRAGEIARDTGAPRNYTGKVLNALTKAGLVESARGPAGGFMLACDPATISVATIVDLFNAPRANPRCLMGDTQCNPDNPCPAHARWTAVLDAQRSPLDTTTIADLLGSRWSGRKPGTPQRSNTDEQR